ncbi:MAG TPA: alpha/beta fold hydrolase [Pyrinomonadaceae bacterium]|nr:alpha/beta fold hydrolase [Pyrinomonadaceae bacterium]
MPIARVRGIELAYDDEGTGRGVVLLHGYPFNRSMWRRQIVELKGFCRVITPDLRGHGESQVAPSTIETMARDVEALMTALEIPNATIGGLSMGGYVALAFYRLFPLRVRELVLADTRASVDTEEGKQDRSKQKERALREGMNGIADDLLAKLFAPSTPAKHPEVVEQVRGMVVHTNPEGAAAALTAMAERDDQTTFLSRIVCSTLIICGRHDTITPLLDSELMQREIAGSKLVVIEEAGHVSNLEQPEQFNRALVGFLQQQD